MRRADGGGKTRPRPLAAAAAAHHNPQLVPPGRGWGTGAKPQ